MFEGVPHDTEDLIAHLMSNISLAIFWSPIDPIGIPLAFGGTFFRYWTEKLNLLRKNKTPGIFTPQIIIFYLHLIPILPCMWAITYCSFMNDMAG